MSGWRPRRDAESNVRRLWSRLTSQRERVLRLQRTMLPASIDNQQLASRSRSAGQIGLLEQLQINRQALDAERELNDALSEYRSTQIELELAAGLQSKERGHEGQQVNHGTLRTLAVVLLAAALAACSKQAAKDDHAAR